MSASTENFLCAVLFSFIIAFCVGSAVESRAWGGATFNFCLYLHYLTRHA